MSQPDLPWSLKGISDEAREFATAAARDSGQTVGAWLSGLIRAAGAEQGVAPDQPAATAPAGGPVIARAPDREGPAPADANTIERAVQLVSSSGGQPEGPASNGDIGYEDFGSDEHAGDVCPADPAAARARLAALEQRLLATSAAGEPAPRGLADEMRKLRRQLAATGT